MCTVKTLLFVLNLMLSNFMAAPITYVNTSVIGNSKKLLFTPHYARFYMLQEKVWEGL